MRFRCRFLVDWGLISFCPHAIINKMTSLSSIFYHSTALHSVLHGGWVENARVPKDEADDGREGT